MASSVTESLGKAVKASHGKVSKVADWHSMLSLGMLWQLRSGEFWLGLLGFGCARCVVVRQLGNVLLRYDPASQVMLWQLG